MPLHGFSRARRAPRPRLYEVDPEPIPPRWAPPSLGRRPPWGCRPAALLAGRLGQTQGKAARVPGAVSRPEPSRSRGKGPGKGMASGQKDRAAETDAWRCRAQGAVTQAEGTSVRRGSNRKRGTAESERGRQNYNRQERRRQSRPGLLLSGTVGVRQAPQGFFQLQEVFSMPYL